MAQIGTKKWGILKYLSAEISSEKWEIILDQMTRVSGVLGQKLGYDIYYIKICALFILLLTIYYFSLQ